MITPKRYDRIAFVASAGTEAQLALEQLVELYGNHDPAAADVVVALGGDGLMLQTLHQQMRTGKPIYGMHRGTVGFLMNEFATQDLHARLAEAVGIDPDDIFKGENGLPLEIDERGARFGEPEQSGMIFVDGVDIGDPADVALRDRRMLSADGIFIVVATVSEQDGESVAPPEVIFRGVPFLDQADGLVDDIRAEVERSLERSARDGLRDIDLLQQELHDDLAAFVYDRLRRRPMVLPVVVEV